MEKIKHYFASANTGDRFVNHFNYINNNSKPGFMYILKGGPGTGKSTLIKKIGDYFYQLGYKIELFHCSSDKDSLDGVRLVEKNICIVDGTAPHVTEATIPSVKDKIVNVGAFIGDKVANKKEKIIHLLKLKKNSFEMAYSYIETASKLSKLNNVILQPTLTDIDTEREVQKIISYLDIEKLEKKSYERKLFQSVIDKEGKIDIFPSNNYSQILVLTNNQLINQKIILGLINKFVEYGFDVTEFLDLLNPQFYESIYLPELDVFITQQTTEHNSLVKYNNRTITSLLKKAGKCLINARTHHKKIESYYISNMNFYGLNSLTKELINEIEKK